MYNKQYRNTGILIEGINNKMNNVLIDKALYEAHDLLGVNNTPVYKSIDIPLTTIFTNIVDEDITVCTLEYTSKGLMLKVPKTDTLTTQAIIIQALPLDYKLNTNFTIKVVYATDDVIPENEELTFATLIQLISKTSIILDVDNVPVLDEELTLGDTTTKDIKQTYITRTDIDFEEMPITKDNTFKIILHRGTSELDTLVNLYICNVELIYETEGIGSKEQLTKVL